MKLSSRSYLVFAGFIAIFFVIFFIYYPTIYGFFFQDDWFSISISQVKKIEDVFLLFIPRKDVIYYRPLGMQIFFLVMTHLFGLNASPFHLAVFILHFINVILVWKIIRLLTRNNIIGFLVSFFYGVSSMHFILFFWPSTFAFVLGPFWYFLTFFFYVRYGQSRLLKYKVMSFICLVLGFFTYELIVTVPLILVLYELIIKRSASKIKSITPFFIPLIFYYFLRFYVGDVPLSESYEPSITNVFSTLRTYILWLFNWPEEIRNQFIAPFTINPGFVKDFSGLINILVLVGGVIVVLSVMGLIVLVKNFFSKKHSSALSINIIAFGLSWFAINFFPLVIFPKHTFPYYLTVPSLGFYLAIGFFVWIVFERIVFDRPRVFRFIFILVLILVLLFLWTFGTYQVVQFNYQTHWAAKRSRITKVLLGEFKKNYPDLPDHTVVVLPNDELLRVVLNGQLAIRILYKNDTIETHFTEGKEEELEKYVPKDDQKLIERYPFKITFPKPI